MVIHTEGDCAMSSIMVFIPAYRCEKQITRVLRQFSEKTASRFAEIVVVDNRSPDSTLANAAKALRELKGTKGTLLQNDKNYSLGGSHKVAFEYCIEKGYDNLVVLHGDDQGSIHDILPFLDEGLHQQYESLLGARFASGSRLNGYSRFRTAGNIIFNKSISLAIHHKVYDMGSGLNCYRTDFLRKKFYMHFPDDLTFNVYMLLYGIWKKSSLKFFPLSWREDDQVSNAKIFKQGWHILKLIRKYIQNADNLFKEQAFDSKKYTYQQIFLD